MLPRMKTGTKRIGWRRLRKREEPEKKRRLGVEGGGGLVDLE